MRTARTITRGLILIPASLATLLLGSMSASAATTHNRIVTHNGPASLRMNCPQSGGSGERDVTASADYGKFVGDYNWGAQGSPHGSTLYYIDVNGTLSSSRGTTTLYLDYHLCGSPHTDQIASVGGGHSMRISMNPAKESLDYGPYTNVRVLVCNNYNGYRCSHPT
jgi:hypothetical protein